MPNHRQKPLVFFIISFIFCLQACESSTSIDQMEFVSSSTYFEAAALPAFEVTLKNSGNTPVETAFDVSFADEEVIDYFGKRYSFEKEAMGDSLSATIEPRAEHIFRTTLEADFPEHLLEKMDAFTLTLYEKDLDAEEVKTIVVGK